MNFVLNGSLRIMEPGLLQLQNGADHARRQHDALAGSDDVTKTLLS
jgi:hypothetical protein